MKIQIFRVLVLLVSISAASALVWNAARDRKPKETQEESAFNTDDMQSSSKSALVFGAGEVVEIVDDSFFTGVTDEEVKRTREMMLSTSKSGRIMSDDKIREMLEKEKKEELKLKSDPHLMNSSKSGPAMTFDELSKFLETRQKASPKDDAESQEPLMHSSKSFSGPIFKPKELEKIVEGDKKEDGLLPPQEPDK